MVKDKIKQVDNLELCNIYKLKENEVFHTFKDNKKYFYKIIDYVPVLICVSNEDKFFPKVRIINKAELKAIAKEM